MPTYQTPGVYREEVFPPPAVEWRTGVPAFLGLAREKSLFSAGLAFHSELNSGILSQELRQAFENSGVSLSERTTVSVEEEDEQWLIADEGSRQTYLVRREKGRLGVYAWVPANVPQMLTLWSQFEEKFDAPLAEGYLAYAVRGFFENGGLLCYVVRLDRTSPTEALRKGLEALAPLNTIDLVCAPDIMKYQEQATALQQMVLTHCQETGDRFAILDSLPAATTDDVVAQRQALSGANGALYYPWVKVLDGTAETGAFVPPCGHVAGVYARSDQRVGVHKAPANEVLEGVLDLEVDIAHDQQGDLNPQGVNCLRSFPGRGIRVWGARTLSSESAWMYVNVRRLFLTVGRWVELNLADAMFEPNDQKLWVRIARELTAYFNDLFQRGAFKGSAPQEAFYIKCDASLNPREVRDAGMVVTEIGLAPAVPGEFVVVRIIYGTSGVTLQVLPTPTTTVSPVPRPSRFTRQLPATVRIAYIEYDPEGRDLDGEYVLIKNYGGAPANLTNWTLSDLSGHEFVFPSLTLGPNVSVRVWTKRGTNAATDLYWGRRAAVWTNIGDRAYLRDSAGELVYVYTYTPMDAWLSSG